MYEHEKQARSGKYVNKGKNDIIVAIHKAGLELDYEVDSRHDLECEAYERESELIRTLPDLCNVGCKRYKPKPALFLDELFKFIYHCRKPSGLKYAERFLRLFPLEHVEWYLTAYPVARELYKMPLEYICRANSKSSG